MKTSAAALTALLLCSCPKESAADPPRARKDPAAKDYVGPPMAKGHVVIQTAYGGAVAVEVEIASTPESQQRGLMWRESLAAGTGMLFVFDDVAVHSFWMKNTLIPLDMIFIGPDLAIAGVVENAEPRTLTARSVQRPSKYVLEVPAGWASKVGATAGAKVTLQIPPSGR